MLILSVSLLVWAYGAYADIRYRRVQNSIWLVLGAMGVLRVSQTPALLSPVLIGVAVLYPISYTLYHYDLIGGADAKAFFVIPLLYADLTPLILTMSVLWALPWHFYTGDRDIPLLVPLATGVATTLVLDHLLLFPQVS